MHVLVKIKPRCLFTAVFGGSFRIFTTLYLDTGKGPVAWPCTGVHQSEVTPLTYVTNLLTISALRHLDIPSEGTYTQITTK